MLQRERAAMEARELEHKEEHFHLEQVRSAINQHHFSIACLHKNTPLSEAIFSTGLEQSSGPHEARQGRHANPVSPQPRAGVLNASPERHLRRGGHADCSAVCIPDPESSFD